MSSLTVHYNPKEVEAKWRDYWEQKHYFATQIEPEKPSYSVVMPPPNITGVLHLGHVLNDTVQDILCRRARILGKNVCWVSGTDHASIATEAKVWQRLAKSGLNKDNTDREEFLREAYAWRAEFGSIIVEQLKRMGLAIDWRREVFTLDKHYSQAVSQVFRDFHARGWIYRSERMVNWDPQAKTVISDEEVVHSEEQARLYYIEYQIENSAEKLLIATRRPETIMGDMAVAVNPEDPRYQQFIGKNCIVPLINRVIPIIADSYVDREFGTGALKITPAHDFNDYVLAEKHNLPKLTIFDAEGRINSNSPIGIGLTREEAREFVLAELRKIGALRKEESFQGTLGYSQRTNAVVEPRISTQWFLRMDKLAKMALEALETGALKIYPTDRFTATYRHWLENPRDWCISRQLWWGHRIPVFYNPEGEFVVAENKEEAQKIFREKYGQDWKIADLHQDEDCLDTWFSSWLWPIEVFRGITEPGNPEFQYFFPTQVLVTGHDILFFWVARMVMFSMAYTGKSPFNTVYFTGMVRDEQGRKMSKSLGNSPDVLALMDQYGADALRFAVMIATPAGNDLLFDAKALEQGRNFNNKLWNALKLYQLWQNKTMSEPEQIGVEIDFACAWIEARLAWVVAKEQEAYVDYKLNEVLKLWYGFLWNDFCALFLEWIKPARGFRLSEASLQIVARVFLRALQGLHPFLPFLTAEIASHLCPNLALGKLGLDKLQIPSLPDPDNLLLERASRVDAIIRQLRQLRQELALPKKQNVAILIQSVDKDYQEFYQSIWALFKRLVGAEEYVENGQKTRRQEYVLGKDILVVFVPEGGDLGQEFSASERAKAEADLARLRQFLAGIEQKMANPKFLANAGEAVVLREEQKKRDTLAKIQVLEQQLGK